MLRRLDSKTLDARSLKEIEHGLNWSPFEARAVLEVVREAYLPFLDEQCVKAPPGKITLIAVSADEPAGKPVWGNAKTTGQPGSWTCKGTRDLVATETSVSSVFGSHQRI